MFNCAANNFLEMLLTVQLNVLGYIFRQDIINSSNVGLVCVGFTLGRKAANLMTNSMAKKTVKT